MKDKLAKILNKSVSKNILAPQEGAEDCGCDFNEADAFDFIWDCVKQDDATLSNKTEKFCTKEPKDAPGWDKEPFSECQGRCKRTYTCVKRAGGGSQGPGAFSSKVIYGQCQDPKEIPDLDDAPPPKPEN